MADLPSGWLASNRAHGFRSYVSERGLRIMPRAGAEPAWDWGPTLVGYGRAGAGIGPRPAQRRADDAAPIAPGLRSHTPGAVRLTALGRTALGGGTVKLEYELKPRAA